MNNESLLSEFNQSPYYRIETEIALCNGCQSENRNLCRILTVSRNVPYVKNRLRNDTEFCQREIMKSWIVLLCELFSIWPTAQETGEGDAIVISHRTKPGIYFRMIPVSLANLEYQSRMDMRLSALPAKNGCPRCGWRRGINERRMQMEWRVPGGKVLPSWRKSDSCVMNRHLITDETKLGSVWYVRKCPWMNRVASVPNGMRSDEAKQRASRIEKPCRAWILYWMRGVWEMTCPRGRKVCWNGMMLTACPRWDMRRDDDCGFVWRDIPDRDLPPSCPTPSFPFQAPADFKKNAALSLLYCFFFFFTRVTQLAKNHSWSAKRNAGNGDLHMVRSCCGNLYENESILSYLYVHIGSNGVIETWVRWVLPFGLSKKCKH